VDTFGYEVFFTGTALLGLPVVALMWLAARAHVGGGLPKASG
jgi:MFS transporter, PAT family, beta-lactamase induction signal transducer AmpG